jgi:NAD(P)-dependent dehydrogenase (short-subunit alcohol dehydrogenase family)
MKMQLTGKVVLVTGRSKGLTIPGKQLSEEPATKAEKTLVS